MAEPVGQLVVVRAQCPGDGQDVPPRAAVARGAVTVVSGGGGQQDGNDDGGGVRLRGGAQGPADDLDGLVDGLHGRAEYDRVDRRDVDALGQALRVCHDSPSASSTRFRW
jgi:hypothetical protein